LVEFEETGLVEFEETGLVEFEETGLVEFEETGLVEFEETRLVEFEETGLIPVEFNLTDTPVTFTLLCDITMGLLLHEYLAVILFCPCLMAVYDGVSVKFQFE